MITMRLKPGPAVSSEWKCLFCIHVRNATIALGIWQVILHAIVLCDLLVFLRNINPLLTNPDSFEFINANGNFQDELIEGLPTPLSKIDHSIPTYYQRDHSLYYPDFDLAVLVTLCTLSFTFLLVHGAIRGKATYLLPFFCFQLFNFAASTLTATVYACYIRNMHLVFQTWEVPFLNHLMQKNSQYLSLVILLAFIISMIIKAYCINIVWRCYKYLTFRQQALRSAIHYIMPRDVTDRTPPVELDYSSLLPDYEAACKQAPPPSYQAAVAGMAAVSTSNTNSVNSTETTADIAAVPVTESVPQSPVASTSTAHAQVITISDSTTLAKNSVTIAVPPVQEH